MNKYILTEQRALIKLDTETLKVREKAKDCCCDCECVSQSC